MSGRAYFTSMLKDGEKAQVMEEVNELDVIPVTAVCGTKEGFCVEADVLHIKKWRGGDNVVRYVQGQQRVRRPSPYNRIVFFVDSFGNPFVASMEEDDAHIALFSADDRFIGARVRIAEPTMAAGDGTFYGMPKITINDALIVVPRPRCPDVIIDATAAQEGGFLGWRFSGPIVIAQARVAMMCSDPACDGYHSPKPCFSIGGGIGKGVKGLVGNVVLNEEVIPFASVSALAMFVWKESIDHPQLKFRHFKRKDLRRAIGAIVAKVEFEVIGWLRPERRTGEERAKARTVHLSSIRIIEGTVEEDGKYLCPVPAEVMLPPGMPVAVERPNLPGGGANMRGPSGGANMPGPSMQRPLQLSVETPEAKRRRVERDMELERDTVG